MQCSARSRQTFSQSISTHLNLFFSLSLYSKGLFPTLFVTPGTCDRTTRTSKSIYVDKYELSIRRPDIVFVTSCLSQRTPSVKTLFKNR